MYNTSIEAGMANIPILAMTVDANMAGSKLVAEPHWPPKLSEALLSLIGTSICNNSRSNRVSKDASKKCPETTRMSSQISQS
jgi:hypothetical protein